MQYFGGKQRISKELSKFLNEQLKPGQVFIDAFCGSCNVISKIDKNRRLIANDNNKYLIAMWKALQIGWIPPGEVSEELYKYVKNNKEEDLALTSFVGFGCSFGGKFFGGYARNSTNQNYAKCAKNSSLKKSVQLKEVEFYNLDYKELLNNVDVENSLTYCDIPYKDTTGYTTGKFDHEEFYDWAKNAQNNGHTVLVSEYKRNVPKDSIILWEKESKQDMKNKLGEKNNTIEVVFTF